MSQFSFVSLDDEINFWKNKAEDVETELVETQQEFRLFELSSKELEHELELQLNDYENRNKTLLINNDKINLELENLKAKYKDNIMSYNKQINELQDELTRLKGEKSTLQRYVRELEQNNDDLERANRATVVSLQDFEEKLHEAIEKNVLLENELEEKETMVETVQRLKDEARDLRQDLEVKEVSLQNVRKSQVDEALVTSMIEEQEEQSLNWYCQGTQTDESVFTDSTDASEASIHDNSTSTRHYANNNNIVNNGSNFNSSHYSIRSPTRYSSPTAATSFATECMDTSQIYSNQQGNFQTLTPAARLSALNLVSDMLRKVGAIEHKLTSANQRTQFPDLNIESSNPSTSGRMSTSNNNLRLNHVLSPSTTLSNCVSSTNHITNNSVTNMTPNNEVCGSLSSSSFKSPKSVISSTNNKLGSPYKTINGYEQVASGRSS